MIYFLTTAPHTYTVGDYLKCWAGRSHVPVKMLAYETLPTILPRGTYSFSDLERLSAAQAMLSAEVWSQLAAAGDGIRLLNHPLKAARRLTLLQRLHGTGRNEFRAFRATDRLADVRFPVFVRQESEHTGACTGLPRDYTEVDHAIVRLLTAMSGNSCRTWRSSRRESGRHSRPWIQLARLNRWCRSTWQSARGAFGECKEPLKGQGPSRIR